MNILTAVSTNPDLDGAISEIVQKLQSDPSEIQYCIVFATVEYEISSLSQKIADVFPNAKIHGGTSCQGLMSDEGFFSENNRALGVWAISGSDTFVGLGFSELMEDSDAQKTARETLEKALQDVGRDGEAPDLVFLTATPGYEEDAIKGIEEVVGTDVPIAGGSPADNTIEGNWRHFTRGKIFQDGIMITVMFTGSEIEVGVAFSSGYMPSGKSGVVTRADKRVLYEIDGRPAAEVYNEWSEGAIQHAVEQKEGVVLQDTTLYPIGREVGRMGSVPYYMLSHPERVTKEGALTLFSEVYEGDRLELMKGSLDSLSSRAGRVASFLMKDELRVDEIAGAFVVYCAGCMLTVGDGMPQVVSGLKENLPGIPFMGVFTFGEQGCFKNGETKNGNLMISVILFGRK